MLYFKTDLIVPTSTASNEQKTSGEKTSFLLAFWKPLKKKQDPDLDP